MSIKTRFAPSPTGEVHFGNIRTALFNYLTSVRYNGSFLLRIEDTDEERSSKEYEELLFQDMKWLGLRWNEGADASNSEIGDNGPYRQSLRAETYNKYYDILLSNDKAYYCFCSEAQLALSRKLQRTQGLPPRYTGTCANLSKEEIDKKLADGQMPTVRFRVDKDSEVKFTDKVKGEQVFKGSDIGDFIIRRANGTASFMFCNAIDDAMMGVKLVLRGEDHLTNTPRQIMILNTLGLEHPEYGHTSLIVGPDNSPLSKRHGSKSIKTLREEGYLPQAIVNYLARLGHKYDSLDYAELDMLGKNFNLDNLSSSPAHYDEQHLLYWQKEAVLKISQDEFKTWIGDVLFDCPHEKRDGFTHLMQQNILFPKEAGNWAKILFTDDIKFSRESIESFKETGIDFFEIAEDFIQTNFSNFNIKELIDCLKDKTGLKGKNLFMPIRQTLTTMDHGPELANLVELMGVERVLTRFKNITDLIK